MGSDWRRGSCLTEDMSKFNKAKREVKLAVFVSAHEGGFTGRQGKNSLDFQMVPASSCAVLSYLFVLLFVPCNISSPGRSPGACIAQKSSGEVCHLEEDKKFWGMRGSLLLGFVIAIYFWGHLFPTVIFWGPKLKVELTACPQHGLRW